MTLIPFHTYQQANTLFLNKQPLKPVTASVPMERNQADLVDLSSVACGEFRYALVIIDVHSRFMWLKALTSKSAQEVATNLENVWQSFGTPRCLQTDNGKVQKQPVFLNVLCMQYFCSV